MSAVIKGDKLAVSMRAIARERGGVTPICTLGIIALGVTLPTGVACDEPAYTYYRRKADAVITGNAQLNSTITDIRQKRELNFRSRAQPTNAEPTDKVGGSDSDFAALGQLNDDGGESVDDNAPAWSRLRIWPRFNVTRHYAPPLSGSA